LSALFVRAGVHFAVVGDDLVSLDVRRGAYACFPGLGPAVRFADDGAVRPLIPEVLEPLSEAGLLSLTAGAPNKFAPPPPLPKQSAWRTAAPAVETSDRRRLFAAAIGGVPAYWTRPFGALLAEAAGRIHSTPQRIDDATCRDAQVFDRLLPFVPLQGECLFRSYLLLRFLRLGGRDAGWVIGVQTYPFQAHCWLQVGDTVLDDAAERLGGYTPILAV
jgi:hypothetical protein